MYQNRYEENTNRRNKPIYQLLSFHSSAPILSFPHTAAYLETRQIINTAALYTFLCFTNESLLLSTSPEDFWIFFKFFFLLSMAHSGKTVWEQMEGR